MVWSKRAAVSKCGDDKTWETLINLSEIKNGAFNIFIGHPTPTGITTTVINLNIMKLDPPEKIGPSNKIMVANSNECLYVKNNLIYVGPFNAGCDKFPEAQWRVEHLYEKIPLSSFRQITTAFKISNKVYPHSYLHVKNGSLKFGPIQTGPSPNHQWFTTYESDSSKGSIRSVANILKELSFINNSALLDRQVTLGNFEDRTFLFEKK